MLAFRAGAFLPPCRFFPQEFFNNGCGIPLPMFPKHIRNKVQLNLDKLLFLHSTPHAVGLGFAIGTFVAFLPVPGVGIPLALLLLYLIPALNRIAVLGGLVVWNPLVSIPLYVVGYWIGGWLFGPIPILTDTSSILHEILPFLLRFLVGTLLMSLAISIASYFAARFIFQWYLNRMSKRT